MIHLNQKNNQIYGKGNGNKKLLFKSLETNLKVGKEVYNWFGREIGPVKSSTEIEKKIFNHPNYNDTRVQTLNVIAGEYLKGIKNLRNGLSKHYSDLTNNRIDLNDYLRKVLEQVKKTRFANCGEQSTITQFKLLQKGNEAHRLTFNIYDKITDNSLGDHVFTIFGLPKSFDLSPFYLVNLFKNPASCGSEAVIVDPWAKIVAKSDEALEKYKKMFHFDPTQHDVVFLNIDDAEITPDNFKSLIRR